MAVARFTGLRPVPSMVDPATRDDLDRVERLLETPGNTTLAVRTLRGIVASDGNIKRAWELGVRAFKGVRYDYVPPENIVGALVQGRRYLSAGDRTSCVQVARQLVSHDPELKQAWELGFAAFE